MDVGWGVDPPFRDTQKWCWSIPHEFHCMLYMDLSPWYLSYVFHVMIYVCIHHIPIISPVYVIHVFSPHYKRSDSWLIVSNIPITCYIYYICIWYDISRNISIICYTSYIHIISHYILYILYIYIPLYIYIYTHHIPHDIPVISPSPGRKAPCEPWDRWASERTVPGPKCLRARHVDGLGGTKTGWWFGQQQIGI